MPELFDPEGPLAEVAHDLYQPGLVGADQAGPVLPISGWELGAARGLSCRSGAMPSMAPEVAAWQRFGKTARFPVAGACPPPLEGRKLPDPGLAPEPSPGLAPVAAL